MAEPRYFFKEQYRAPVEQAIWQAQVNATMAEAQRAAAAQEQQRQQVFAWQLEQDRQAAAVEAAKHQAELIRQNQIALERERRVSDSQSNYARATEAMAAFKRQKEWLEAQIADEVKRQTKLFDYYGSELQNTDKQIAELNTVTDADRAKWIEAALQQSGFDPNRKLFTKGNEANWPKLLLQAKSKDKTFAQNYEDIVEQNRMGRLFQVDALNKRKQDIIRERGDIRSKVDIDLLPRTTPPTAPPGQGQAGPNLGALIGDRKGVSATPQATPNRTAAQKPATNGQPNTAFMREWQTAQPLINPWERAQAVEYGVGKGLARTTGASLGGLAQLFNVFPAAAIANKVFDLPSRLSATGEQATTGAYDYMVPSHLKEEATQHPYLSTALGETVGQAAPLLLGRGIPRPSAPPVIPNAGFTMPRYSGPATRQGVPPVIPQQNYSQIFGVRPPQSPTANTMSALVPYGRGPTPATVPPARALVRQPAQPIDVAAEVVPGNYQAQGPGPLAWTRPGVETAGPRVVYEQPWTPQLLLQEPMPEYWPASQPIPFDTRWGTKWIYSGY